MNAGKARSHVAQARDHLVPVSPPHLGQGEQGKHGQNEQSRLLSVLGQLLSIQATDIRSVLDQVCNLITEALGADKVDVFLYAPQIDTLVTAGASDTALARQEHNMGLDRFPLSNGGRTVEVFQTGNSFSTGHAGQDSGVLLGVRTGLHVQSILMARFSANGDRRGVLQALSRTTDRFSPDDLVFLEAVSHWIGMLIHQAEMSEKLNRDALEEARRVTAEDVVTVLAHDLGNYLTPLKARIDLILRRAQREGQKANLRDATDAKDAIERLRSLIEDLLDAARVGQDIFTMSMQPVDLVELVQQTADVIGTQDGDILLELPEELVLQADPSRIRQALENLLSNAIRHSPEMVPVHIHLRTDVQDDEEWAVISVRDEGPGIEPSLLPKLFTRFGAGHDSVGLGLGLYLAQGIVTAHRGKLTVVTAAGQGTTFKLSLPMSSGALPL